MKTLTFLCAIVLALLSTPASAQDARTQRFADVCHLVAGMASLAATGRTQGKSLREMLDVIHMMSLKSVAPEDKDMFAVIATQMEQVIIEVYASKLTPDDAYLTYRQQCRAAAAKKLR